MSGLFPTGTVSVQKFLPALVFLLTLHAPAGASAATYWVSDVLYVPVRSGPSNQYRVKKSLKTGTPVTVVNIDEEAKYAEVRLEDGTDGYMPTQYLSPQPIAAIKLERAEARIQKLMETRTPMQSQLAELEESNAALTREVTGLRAEKEALSKELDHIREVSANTVAIDARNRELLAQSRELKTQIDELHAENERLQDKSGRNWFQLGAFTVAGGVLLGLLLPYLRPRRRQRSGWT